MTPLRIALVGPMNKTSSIAMNGVRVANELARRGHSVTMVRSEVGPVADSEPRAVAFEVRNLSDMSDEELIHQFDVVLAQFGDNHQYHGALLERLGRVPMVAILHDATIPNLMLLWAFHGAPSEAAALERIAAIGADLYGSDAVRDVRWTDPMSYATRFPMLEYVSSRLDGAVIHAGHYHDRVAGNINGPVRVIPLVEDDLILPPLPAPRPGKLTVGVLGNVNPNKRIDQLLIAIAASSQLRRSVQVKVIGHVEERRAESIRSMATALGVAPPIFTGWVEDQQMSAEMAEVDVISCLRFPVLEGASGSLVVALRSGRPTLVSRHGAYAETPDDMALFCEPGNEARDLLLHLERLMADPAHGQAMGARAREWVTKRHSVDAYVDELERFLIGYVRSRPILNAQRLMGDVFAKVGIDRDDSAAERGRAALAELVGQSA